jgi:ferredoxin--NADP+ reductase
MVDGTGMCGGCRATVDNKTVFVCVDGPEFDAHKVDFKTLMTRNYSYLMEEKVSLKDHECKLNKLHPHSVINH